MVVKNPPADVEDTRDAGLVPGSGRSLRVETATHSIILAWETPQTEDAGSVVSGVAKNWT